MTREEAIEYLDGMKIVIPICNELKELTDERNEAIDMAIEALSADAVQGVGRYENAMQKLREMPKYLNGVKAKQIKKIPSDAVHGEWEHWGSPFSDESEVIDTIVCSVCGARFIEPKDEPKGEYNYCPNCGAIMKGGAE